MLKPDGRQDVESSIIPRKPDLYMPLQSAGLENVVVRGLLANEVMRAAEADCTEDAAILAVCLKLAKPRLDDQIERNTHRDWTWRN